MGPQQAAAQQQDVGGVGVGQQVDGDGGIGNQLVDDPHGKGLPVLVVLQKFRQGDVRIDRARLG